MSPEEDQTRDAVDSEPKHYQLSYSGPNFQVWGDRTFPVHQLALDVLHHTTPHHTTHHTIPHRTIPHHTTPHNTTPHHATRTVTLSHNNNNNNNNRIQRRYSRFFTISSQCHILSPTRTLKWPWRNRVHITCNTLSAYHVQHVVLRAAWYKGTAQLVSSTELKSHLFQLYFVGWIIILMKEGRKPEYLEKTPGDELQKMPHTTARRFKPQARLEPMQ